MKHSVDAGTIPTSWGTNGGLAQLSRRNATGALCTGLVLDNNALTGTVPPSLLDR